jgi:16S rRNA pseudouridine516 synthase
MEECDIKTFADGMEFKEFTAKSARLEITENPNEVYIEIAEGKFHQVKRMCERVGKNVIYLKRVAIGSLSLDESLGLGEIRELTAAEMEKLGYSIKSE